MCHVDTADDIIQFFIVVDRRVLLELERDASFQDALYMLISVHFSYNIEYKTTQKMFYVFVEEYCMGCIPKKKTVKYSKLVREVFGN